MSSLDRFNRWLAMLPPKDNMSHRHWHSPKYRLPLDTAYIYVWFICGTNPRNADKKQQLEVFTWGHGGHGRLGLGQAKALSFGVSGLWWWFCPWQKTARVHGCPSNLDRCEASLEPKIAPVAPLKSFQMFSELKRLQNSWVQILYCISTYLQFWTYWVLLGWPKIWSEGWIGSVGCDMSRIMVLSEEFLQCWVRPQADFAGWRVKGEDDVQ